MIVVFKSCLVTRAEPDRGIAGLHELEFVGVCGLPIMGEPEPLEKACPFQYFQMAFVTIPVNPFMFGAQILMEIGSINMFANDVLVPACDPGSLNTYAHGLSIHMLSIVSSLGLTGVE
jgi:hypothetical protein